jgi:hypothetical protein
MAVVADDLFPCEAAPGQLRYPRKRFLVTIVENSYWFPSFHLTWFSSLEQEAFGDDRRKMALVAEVEEVVEGEEEKENCCWGDVVWRGRVWGTQGRGQWRWNPADPAAEATTDV